jgi:hypothetical protein
MTIVFLPSPDLALTRPRRKARFGFSAATSASHGPCERTIDQPGYLQRKEIGTSKKAIFILSVFRVCHPEPFDTSG